jgi:CelD/BcsL family acetyltransferase involved in cellulose biosynthesis
VAIKAETTTATELGEAELAQWREWQAADKVVHNPFLAPEFAYAKAKFLKKQFVAVLREGNDIVGYMPYEKVDKAVGVPRGVIAKPGTSWDVRPILSGTGLSVFEYLDLVPEQKDALQTRGAIVRPVATVDLTNGWDAWIAEKSKSSNVKRYMRKGRTMERDLGETEFKLSEPDHDILDQFMLWKSAHNDRTGNYNRYAIPEYRAMVHWMLDNSSNETFEVQLSTYRAGGRLLAMQLAMVANDMCTAWQTTHDPDPELNKYSAGMTMMLNHYEGLAKHGVKIIDLGVGPSPYKPVMKNYDTYVVEGYSDRPSAPAYIRRAKMAPKRTAVHFVQEHPEVNKKVRETLHKVHGFKQKLRGKPTL